MSISEIVEGQECFRSLKYSLSKDGIFKSFPEFDCIYYPFYNLDDLDEIRVDCLPHGIEEGKHIWDFRYNKAAWIIEKINRKFNYLTQLYLEKPMEFVKWRMILIWFLKEEYKRLKELDDVKKQMTVETTEELKSPLHIMSNAAELLLNLYKDKLDTKAIELLEMIQRGGERSMGLVGKMIDISRIESQEFKLEKQTESLIETIRDSVDEVVAQQKQDFFINFDVLEDLYAEVDKVRIGHVIKDLLLRLNPDELFEIQSEIYLLLEKYNQARDSNPKHPPPPPTGGG